MELDKAILKAEEAKEIREIKNLGGFLCSGYVILDCEGEKESIKEWNLNYYNPQNEKITHIRVWNDGYEVGIEDDPLREKEYEEFKKDIKVTGEEAIKIAEKAIDVKLCTKMIVSLQKYDKHEIWSISFISKIGSVSNVKIDVKTGEILFSEKTNLMEKLDKKFNAS